MPPLTYPEPEEMPTESKQNFDILRREDWRTTLYESQKAKEQLLSLPQHYRTFFLNLLIRPRWTKNKNDLELAYNLGLIDIHDLFDPEFEDEEDEALYRKYHTPLEDIRKLYFRMKLEEAFPHDDLTTVGSTSSNAEESTDGYLTQGGYSTQDEDNIDETIVGELPESYVKNEPIVFNDLPVPPDFLSIQEFWRGRTWFCPLHRHFWFSEFIQCVYSLMKWEFITCANYTRMHRYATEYYDMLLNDQRREIVGRAYEEFIYTTAWQFHEHVKVMQNPNTRYPPGIYPPRFLGYEKRYTTITRTEKYITTVLCRGCFLSRLFTVSNLQNVLLLQLIMRPMGVLDIERHAFSKLLGHILTIIEKCPAKNEEEYKLIYFREVILRGDYTNVKHEYKWNAGVAHWLGWMARRPMLPLEEENGLNHVAKIDHLALAVEP